MDVEEVGSGEEEAKSREELDEREKSVVEGEVIKYQPSYERVLWSYMLGPVGEDQSFNCTEYRGVSPHHSESEKDEDKESTWVI